jgi:hypothetical protein
MPSEENGSRLGQSGKNSKMQSRDSFKGNNTVPFNKSGQTFAPKDKRAEMNVSHETFGGDKTDNYPYMM